MVTPNEGRDSQYNLNESMAILIGDLQREALTLSNSADHHGSLERWNSIRILIQSRFQDDEVDTLDELYYNFYNIKPAVVPLNLKPQFDMRTGLNSKQMFQRKYLSFFQKKRLHEFVRELTLLMRQYKISMTDKEKKPRLN